MLDIITTVKIFYSNNIKNLIQKSLRQVSVNIFKQLKKYKIFKFLCSRLSACPYSGLSKKIMSTLRLPVISDKQRATLHFVSRTSTQRNFLVYADNRRRRDG